MSREADGKITDIREVGGKLYVFTATSTYRARQRKRWRDKNKPQMALLRKVAGSGQ